MKKLLFSLALIFCLTGCVVAPSMTAAPTSAAKCAVPTRGSDTTTPAAVTSEPEQPVLYGLWSSDNGNIIVISQSSLYFVQTESMGGQDSIRETWYDIQDVDWVNGVLTLNMKWVRVNGKTGGFDMPLHYMKVWIDGTTLMYAMGDESQGIPQSADIGPFYKK
jgi:hypothetical protein